MDRLLRRFTFDARSMRYIFLIVIAVLSYNTVFGQFTYDSKVRSAHGAIHELRLKDAGQLISGLGKDQYGWKLYLTHFLKTVEIISSPQEQTYELYVSKSHELLGEIRKIKSESPWKSYCIADMELYEAGIHAKNSQMAKAAGGVSTCYKTLKKSIADHPDFAPSYKAYGLLEAGIGTLPDTYQKMISILGYKGSLNEGYKHLSKAARDTNYWVAREAQYLKMAVELYLMNDPDLAWKTIVKATPDRGQNLVATFFYANTAMKCGRNDEAIRVLQERPTNEEYARFYFLDFLLGTAKLCRLDQDANVYINRFIEGQKTGDYIKSAYNKLLWYCITTGDSTNYQDYRSRVISRGSVALEEDKQALFEVVDGVRPDPELLKVRCLFDGGYYDRALSIIGPMREKQFDLLEHRIEYNYRKGRVYQMLGEDKLAIAFFKEAIERGKNVPLYYAAYAACYIGEIYEGNGDYEKAREYFRKAVDLGKGTTFGKSIEHRSKSGLVRLEGKE